MFLSWESSFSAKKLENTQNFIHSSKNDDIGNPIKTFKYIVSGHLFAVFI